MKPTRFLVPTLAIAMLASAGTSFAQQRYYQPSFRYGNGDAEQALEQRGFRDGARGAERDYQNHRRPDVNNRDEYRNPNFLPPWAQHEYREGFRRGYNLRVKQVYYGENRGYGNDRNYSNGYEGGYRNDRNYGDDRNDGNDRNYGNGYDGGYRNDRGNGNSNGNGR